MLDVVKIVDGKAVTTSRKIAEVFEKKHCDVLRAIRELEVPEDFNERNFASVEYVDQKGERRPEYLITKDGFFLLAMGFTGKKAMEFKICFINAYNTMEKILKEENAICTTMPPSATLRETTVELLNDINLRLLAGESVDKEILRYAWNVGRMFSKPVTLENSSVPIDILEFAETLTPGEYSRGEIYEAYCKHCANPSAARWFWPRLRQACPFTEKRTRYRRMIIIGE
jgi:Rha family phage regulatory protein